MFLSSNLLVPKTWPERSQDSFMKYLQIGFTVFLWAWLLYDFVAHYGTRMSVNPKLTKSLLVLIPVGLLFNLLWTGLLVLWHKTSCMNDDDQQKLVTSFFQAFFIPYTIAIFVCLYYDYSYTSYKNACFAISGLISVYVHNFLTSGRLVPEDLQATATLPSGYTGGAQMRDMNRDQSGFQPQPDNRFQSQKFQRDANRFRDEFN